MNALYPRDVVAGVLFYVAEDFAVLLEAFCAKCQKSDVQFLHIHSLTTIYKKDIIKGTKAFCINNYKGGYQSYRLKTTMKNFVRIITLVLALAMLAVMAAACADSADTPDGADTTPAPQGSVTTPAEGGEDTLPPDVDANGFKLDELPEDLNYGNAEVMILHWEAERDEFSSEGMTGDNLMDAIYDRNIAVESRIGVSLKFREEPGNNKNIDNFKKIVEASYQAGEQEYDIIATYSRTAAQLAINGYYADLNAIDETYLNLDMPWWPESIIDTMGVGDALYYVSGDASTNTLHFMYTLYYNMDLLNDLGMTDPTEFVKNKTWTLDKLIEMTSNQYQDLDSDGALSEGDFYGFGTIYYGADAFYTGSGLRLVEHDEEKLLKISPDYASQKAIDLVDKLGDWMTTNDCYISRSGSSVDFDAPFVSGNMLFVQNRVYMADNKHSSGLNSVEWEYGLVPTPLYDENQENYITVIGNPFTLYGIMNDCAQKEMMTAVIECWGSESFRRTTPALFETNMKYKYTDRAVSVEMFDILRETSSFDQGRIYANTLGPYMSEIPSKMATVGSSWATAVKANMSRIERQLKDIVKSFEKIQ